MKFELQAIIDRLGKASAARIAHILALIEQLPPPPPPKVEDQLAAAIRELSDAELLAVCEMAAPPPEIEQRVALARIRENMTMDDRALGSGHGSDEMKAEGCRCSLCCATDEERAAADAKACAESEERERAWQAPQAAKRAASPQPKRVESDNARAEHTKPIEAQQVKPLSPARNIAAEFDALAAFLYRRRGLSDR